MVFAFAETFVPRLTVQFFIKQQIEFRNKQAEGIIGRTILIIPSLKRTPAFFPGMRVIIIHIQEY